MSFETIINKKFLDSNGLTHLWGKIKYHYDSKLDSVQANNDSITVVDNNKIAVAISAETDNILQLKTTGNKGLYVKAPDDAFNYAIEKDTTSTDYAAVYRLKKYATGQVTGIDAGVSINIPKDMVVQSGSVVNKNAAGAWGPAGTYIELTLANATNDKIYVPVDGLIEYVTSGSQTGDMVVVNVSSNHQVTATISDDSITAAKLAPTVRQNLAQAASAITSITEGSANGTISVDGTNVAVHGLGAAAYADASAFDAAGAASGVLGSSTDTADTPTVYGTKKYASDVYASIMALTNAEIDTAIAASV